MDQNSIYIVWFLIMSIKTNVIKNGASSLTRNLQKETLNINQKIKKKRMKKRKTTICKRPRTNNYFTKKKPKDFDIIYEVRKE